MRPVPVPRPVYTCEEQWDETSLVTQEWYPTMTYQKAFTYGNYLVSQRDDHTSSVTFAAKDETNWNAVYRLTLNEDYHA
jgi:hypothetical protein